MIVFFWAVVLHWLESVQVPTFKGRATCDVVVFQMTPWLGMC